MGRHLARKTFRVESQCLGIRQEMKVVKRVLVLVEGIVHLPEPALRGSRLRTLGRMLRVWMDGREREVPKDEAQLISQLLLDRLDEEMRRAAVGTLEVPVL